MNIVLRLGNLEKLIAHDQRSTFTLISCAVSLSVLLNLASPISSIVSTVASLLYFVINGIFLGRAFFNREAFFIRFMLGVLTLIVFLGLASWMMLIIYNLDTIRVALVLLAVTILSSLMNMRKANSTNRNQRLLYNKEDEKDLSQKGVRKGLLRAVEALYIFFVALVSFLLLASRSGEAYTVWEVLPHITIPIQISPSFFLIVPVPFLLAFFISTFLLLAIIFSSEKTSLKLVFVILHSITASSFYIILFPAGDVGVQQIILGTTRRIYENATVHGYGHSSNLVVQIYYWINGINFQSAYSTIFARMFAVDVFWSHLALVPIIWGTFVPIIIFMISRSLGGSDTVSVLSSLAIAAFPATILWGAFSVPNSLGFFFALCSLYFALRYVSSDQNKSHGLTLIFALASLLSHYLTGIIVISLILLAVSVKSYEREKSMSPVAARYTFVISFVLSGSLLPLALTYHRLLSPLYASFSLSKLNELPTLELFGSFVVGEYFFYSPLNLIVNIAAPMLGLVGLILAFRISRRRKQNNSKLCLKFLVSSFLLFFVTYRILKFFMTSVPFAPERIWIFRDFILAPYLTIFGLSVLALLLHRRRSETLARIFNPSVNFQFFSKVSLRSILIYVLVLASLSSWITASLYYAYPHFAPLQTTSYEIEAVKYIEANTPEKYVVIADQWIIFAGQMFVGLYNPNAYYFAHTDSEGIRLFLEMKNDTSAEAMIEAMKVNNATVAYFIIEKPRLGTETYNRVIQNAQQNNLQTYKIFYYPESEEKLRIFYHEI